MTGSHQWRAGAALAVTLLLWSSAFVVLRHLGSEFSAGSLAVLRLGIGTAVLAGWHRSHLRVIPATGDLLRLAFAGICLFAVYNLALSAAEQRLDAGTAALLMQAAPVMLACLAAIIFKERVSRRMAAGFVVAVLGVAVISVGAGDRSGDAWGSVLCLLAALGYAVGSTTQKTMLTRVSPQQATWWACLFGTGAAALFAGQLPHDLAGASASSWVLVVYLGVFPTAVAASTYARALRTMRATRVALATLLAPVIAIVMSASFLGEAPGPEALIGGAVAIAGVVWGSRGARTAGTSRDGHSKTPASQGRSLQPPSPLEDRAA